MKSAKNFRAWATALLREYSTRRSAARRTRGRDCSWWPTPAARDWRDNAYPGEGKQNSPRIAWRIGGPPNADWLDWLMGLPVGWSAMNGFGVSETEWSHWWRLMRSELSRLN